MTDKRLKPHCLVPASFSPLRALAVISCVQSVYLKLLLPDRHRLVRSHLDRSSKRSELESTKICDLRSGTLYYGLKLNVCRAQVEIF